MAIIGPEYINTFFSSALQKYRYAKEPIIYPRSKNGIYLQYSTDTIQCGYTQYLDVKVGLKPATHGMIRHAACVKREPNGLPYSYIKKSGYVRSDAYWLLTTYYDDGLVTFIQIDIDRHVVTSENDENTRKTVYKLQSIANHYNFDIVWTTSPGYIDDNENYQHGLYAWIKLEYPEFVNELQILTRDLLQRIGLNDVEYSWQSSNRLIRLPGQQNVELADCHSFNKLYSHSPKDALIAFQQAWNDAKPANNGKVFIHSLPPSSSTSTSMEYKVSSLTLSPPLSDKGDTFRVIHKVASKWVIRGMSCRSCLVILADVERCRRDSSSCPAE